MLPRTSASRTVLAGALLAMVLAVTSCTSSEADGKVTVVGPHQAVSLVESGEYVVVDLCPADSFRAGHVAGARSLPFVEGDFKADLAEMDRDATYLLYARHAEVADRAADLMVGMDFQHVVDAGRFGLLMLAGAPVESGSEASGSG